MSKKNKTTPKTTPKTDCKTSVEVKETTTKKFSAAGSETTVTRETTVKTKCPPEKGSKADPKSTPKQDPLASNELSNEGSLGDSSWGVEDSRYKWAQSSWGLEDSTSEWAQVSCGAAEGVFCQPPELQPLPYTPDLTTVSECVEFCV